MRPVRVSGLVVTRIGAVPLGVHGGNHRNPRLVRVVVIGAVDGIAVEENRVAWLGFDRLELVAVLEQLI